MFIGYSRNEIMKGKKDGEESKMDKDKKILINDNSSNSLNKANLIQKPNNSNIIKGKRNSENYDIYNKVKKIFHYSPSPKKYNIYYIKKNNNKYEYNYINNNKENILKKILVKRKKSYYNFKSILKIKNYFKYFAELRKLYNLYKKDLKSINKKINIEKEYTFYPKTNKNNKLFNKFPPSMNFYERNVYIINIKEQKIK